MIYLDAFPSTERSFYDRVSRGSEDDAMGTHSRGFLLYRKLALSLLRFVPRSKHILGHLEELRTALSPRMVLHRACDGQPEEKTRKDEEDEPLEGEEEASGDLEDSYGVHLGSVASSWLLSSVLKCSRGGR